jgi:DNA polymerase-3 subunit gamma/tau
MVFYRKYRSQKIEELDSTSLRNTLYSVLSKEPSHAFLFTGPKGLGKTSTARIIAKVVNCEKRCEKAAGKGEKKKSPESSIEPCNECEQCISITNGTNMDVLEIDAASNRGIDEIRDLREKIRLAPLSARKKVYIIDEVHMLTTEAFNALLKTLEEPPAHAMFILCTTEPQKVPATILSRCFHLSFKLATPDELVRSLKRIRSGEKLLIDDEALYSVAKMAEGGFRDAAKILEELSLLAKGQAITKESFEKIYKISTIPIKVANLLGALKAGNTKSGLQVIGELVLEGVDIRFFISQVLTDLHTKFLKKLGVVETKEDEFPKNLRFEVDEIKIIIGLLSRAYQETKYAVLPQLSLELAILEYTAGNTGSEIDKDTEESEDDGTDVTVVKLRKQAGAMTKIKALYGDSSKQDSSKSDTDRQVVKSDVELLHVPANGEMTKEWMAAFWKGIIAEMKQYNHTIAGVLRSCKIASYNKKLLVIEAGYKFHKERLDDAKTRVALIKTCKKLTGNDMEIEVELKKSV